MFDIQGGKVVLSTESLAIPPFKDYYNNIKLFTYLINNENQKIILNNLYNEYNNN